MKHSAQVFLFGMLVSAPVMALAATPVVTAVFSKTSREYKRTELPDGTFKREHYVIANGKYAAGASPNESIDRVEFPKVAGFVAQYLARKNYYLAPKAEDADFLLLITWGTTIPFGDGTRSQGLSNLSSAVTTARGAMSNLKSAMEAASQVSGPGSSAGQAVRDAEAEAYAANDALEGTLLQVQMTESAQNKANESNAKLLGYIDELNDRNDMSRFAGGGSTYDELLSDIESERYYVTISAVDFKKLVKTQKQVVLWSTRVSIDARRTRFDDALETMVAAAGKQFGQNSKGLMREAQEGTVRLDDIKFIGVKDEAPPAAAEPAKKK